jgi:RNA polymerase sigma factor (sigma-70 family)
MAARDVATIEDSDADAYRVRITVRNNRFLAAIEAAGFKSCAAFAKECGLPYHAIIGLASMRAAPMSEDGTMSEAALRVMKRLNAAPFDLWTEAQLMMKLDRNSSERTMGEEEVAALMSQPQRLSITDPPEDLVAEGEMSRAVEAVLQSLPPIEQQVLRARFGMDDGHEQTLEQVAASLGVTRERIRQIEAKALRRLRHPSRTYRLKSFLHSADASSDAHDIARAKWENEARQLVDTHKGAISLHDAFDLLQSPQQ